jgi:hypothetical protein
MSPIREDVKEKFFPLLSKGDGMWLASSPSQFWRGCGLAAYSGQAKPVGGFYSTVS